MNTLKNKLLLLYKASNFYRLLGVKSDESKGRRCMLASSVLTTISAGLSGGIFFSGFLVGHKIDIVDIGILTFIPYIATFFSFLAPLILERFKNRRWILGISRLFYYAINILGITLLPQIVSDPAQRRMWFILIIFTANAVNFLFNSGYTIWHINFLPENIRADYFNMSGLIVNLMHGIVMVVLSTITDKLQGSAYQLTIITALRYAAFAVAAVEVIILLLPKEFPYPKTAEKIKISDTIRLPIKNKKFVLTISVMCIYTFAANISSPVINTWFIEDVGGSYLFMNAINASFFLFYIVFGNLAKKLINRYSWFKAFALVLALQVPTFFAYGFVTKGNYLWLMLIVRLLQHVGGIFIGVSYGNFVYINLPKEDRTCYISFYTIMVNIAAFFSMISGTYFVKFMGNYTFSIFGVPIGSVQTLLILTGVFELATAGYLMLLLPKITPEPEPAPVPAIQATGGN